MTRLKSTPTWTEHGINKIDDFVDTEASSFGTFWLGGRDDVVGINLTISIIYNKVDA